MTFGIKLHIAGAFACFSRPEMKVERVSYDVMTPTAARGILEAVYWKPSIKWHIDAIKVLKPIKFQSIRRNEVGSKIPTDAVRRAMKTGEVGDLHLVVEDERQQRAATVLVDVAYVIEAHFDMTDRAGPDDNPGKHLDTFNRRARKGQCFHQPSLGTREFAARFALIEPGEALPAAIDDDRDLGFMLYDIDHERGGASSFFRARLDRGVLRIPPPQSPEVRR